MVPDILGALKSHVPVTVTEIQPLYDFSQDPDNKEQLKVFRQKLDSK